MVELLIRSSLIVLKFDDVRSVKVIFIQRSFLMEKKII